MKARAAAWSVVLAAGVAGLFFSPIFGLSALIRPIVAVALVCCLVVELGVRVPALLSWRPVLSLLAGLLAIVETVLFPTTAFGVPTASTVHELAMGVTQSWQLTLQSTWPARPEPDLLLFVPLGVLLAAIVGVELLRWAPAALLPSLLLVGVSQAYLPLTGWTAAGAGFCYAIVAGALLLLSRQKALGTERTARQLGALLWLPTVCLALVGAIAVTALDPVTPVVSLRQNQSAAPPAALVNPLDELAVDLQHPDETVFTYTSSAPVDRWRLVVLDGFDGVTWSPPTAFRRMGTTVALPASVTSPTVRHTATVNVDLDQPWLPSQALPTTVVGTAPLIDQESGVLYSAGDGNAETYQLTWAEPQVDASRLGNAAIDPRAAGGFAGLGEIPPGIEDLASRAVGGLRPSVQAALVLERFLSDNYKLATGSKLPTGAGWPQLTSFLLHTKRGTSEQFAAAYVVLARILGIPARIAFGYRGDQAVPGRPVTVRNRNVLAWPEVAVAGVGWVPLDPTRSAAGSGAASSGLAAAAARARADLPAPKDLKDPPTPPAAAQRSGGAGISLVSLLPYGLLLLILLAVGLISVPLAKTVRRWRRRKKTGAAGVIAAWAEARDLLRSHGVWVTSGMTVRDAAVAAEPITGQSVAAHLRVLAVLVDAALWSGTTTQPGVLDAAWSAVELVRRDLGGRPVRARLAALLRPTSLFGVRKAGGSGDSRRLGWAR
jgi:hypothetical protein